MQQQAKERLTGGVILVVLLVLLVPELLTGPRPVPPAIPAQPDQAPMRSYTMDLGESRHANSAPIAASTAAPEATVQPKPADQSAHDTPAPPAATPNAPVPQVPPPPHAAAHPGLEHAASEHGVRAWTVQLGTFGSRENAARLASGLKSHGFNASIFRGDQERP